MSITKTILVTGASGYIAGALIPSLLEQGYQVRCLARHPERLVFREIFSRVELVQGDVTDYASVNRAMSGVHTAYYLVHNMDSGRAYHQRDMAGARNFARAAQEQGAEHIIYLGGLADPDAKIGFHMRSRIQTGEALRSGTVPVTEFRASLIIGPGSISFEMIRYLTEQMPVVIGPGWMHYFTQPVAIQNVIEYLLAALESPVCRGKVYEIGGPDVMKYREAVQSFARQRGLRRVIITVPEIPVALMAFVVDKITPVPYPIAYPLIDGMRSNSLVQDPKALKDFPQVRPLDYPSSVQAALALLTPASLERTWEDGAQTGKVRKLEGFFVACKQTRLPVSAECAFKTFTGLGGEQGWMHWNGLWKLRGWLDRLVGGPGMRGRPANDRLEVGDVVDFYQVEALIPGRLLRLRTDLRAPGTGWMEWKAQPQPGGDCLLTQTAFFAPRGLSGFLYWYLLLPFHQAVFTGMFKELARRAEKGALPEEGFFHRIARALWWG